MGSIAHRIQGKSHKKNCSTALKIPPLELALNTPIFGRRWHFSSSKTKSVLEIHQPLKLRCCQL